MFEVDLDQRVMSGAEPIANLPGRPLSLAIYMSNWAGEVSSGNAFRSPANCRQRVLR